MRFFIGVTDNNWYNFLSSKDPEDVNFWQPGGNMPFRILAPGAPFLFKLKSPINAIGGVGFFSSHSFLPLSVAWDTFGQRNGCNSYLELKDMILRYRKEKSVDNPVIGCIVLTNPIFFAKEDWIPVPSNWSSSIVQGKSYDSSEIIGKMLWNNVESLLSRYLLLSQPESKNQLLLDNQSAQYGKTILTKVRLGQGAFRILVMDAYSRRCAISGERTLPVLEAAHIKPYSESGPHFISNSLLLRSDLHKLFDTGYLTINQDLTVEVSRRIKEEFENGKDYYKYHGSEVLNLPINPSNKPDKLFLEWHHDNIFKK